MTRNKYVAVLTVAILGLTGLALAQEGYYGQQPASSPAAQTHSTAQMVACACGHMHGDATAAMRAFAPPTAPNPPKAKVRNNEQPPKERGASTQQEGDPNAPQNHVEYGGGGN